MRYTNFQKISPEETRVKWARVFFASMFVTSYNFVTTTHACVSEAHWSQRSVQNSNNKENNFELSNSLLYFLHKQQFFFTNLDAMFVDNSLRFTARAFRVDFEARAIARFQNQFVRGQKTSGSHLNCTAQPRSQGFLLPSAPDPSHWPERSRRLGTRLYISIKRLQHVARA